MYVKGVRRPCSGPVGVSLLCVPSLCSVARLWLCCWFVGLAPACPEHVEAGSWLLKAVPVAHSRCEIPGSKWGSTENTLKFPCLYWGFFLVTKSDGVENILKYFHADGFVLKGN